MKRHETAKWHVTSPPGHVTFRLLFPADAAAAIIGPNGANQKKLLRETGAFKIRVDDSLPGCSERVVNVGGDAKVDRTMTICDEGGGRRVVEVSAAQAAVVRVYELVAAEMSVVRSNECVKNCRLLVVSGVEVWKSDDELKIIEKDCGAFVRLLSPELLPLCADVSDELIEITGASLAVKKALIAVTRCIQGAWGKSSVSCASTSSAPSRNLPAQKDQCHKIESNDNDPSCVLDADTKEVTFKLICPAHASGGLVGWEKTVIKNLEIETGASIMVLPPLVGCDEIVITVSAMESKEWQCSPAQNAAACVFIRSTENGARSKHTSSGNNEVRVKPIVPCDQADGVDLTSNMENTEVQILDAHPTRLAFADEKIIQGHQFSRGTNFQCFASTGDGSIVVGFIDGKIRLYSKTSMRQAKTVFPSLGSPITHVDVTYDGKWVLATTDTYLLLICTLFTDKGGRTKTGFSDRMGNRASAPGMLKLMPLHAHMAGSNSKFRGGQFSWVTEEGNQEHHIVVTVGKFSVIWNFEQVKDSTHKCYQNQRGLKRCYCYNIVLKDESIVDSRFMHDKFADCRSPEAPLVVATPMKVTFFSISAKQ